MLLLCSVGTSRMAKGPSKQPPKTLPLTVPLALFEYLTWLAANTELGTRETEVASHILTEAIRQMIKDKEHERTFPRIRDGGDDSAPNPSDVAASDPSTPG